MRKKNDIDEGKDTIVSTPLDFMANQKVDPQNFEKVDPKEGDDPKEEKPKEEKPKEGDDPKEEKPKEEKPKEGDDPKVDPKEEKPKVTDPKDVKEVEEMEFDFVKFAVDAFKSKGILPEDYVPDDSLDEEFLKQAFVKHQEEPLFNSAKKELLDEFKELGITEDFIENQKALRSGVNSQALQESKKLAFLSSYKFDDKDEHFSDNVLSFLTEYYVNFKKLAKSKAEKLIEVDMNDSDLLNTISDYQKEFKDKLEDIEVAKLEKIKKFEKEKSKKLDERNKFIESLFEKRIIDGVEYSEEDIAKAKSSIFDKTEIVEINGKKYRTTKFNKLQMQMDDDIEKELSFKIKMVLGGGKKVDVNRVRENIGSDFVSELSQYAKTSKKGKEKDAEKPAKEVTNISSIVRKPLN